MLELNKIICGDCLEKMKELESNSVDAVVTDPPYGLSFMGKRWDYDVPSQEIWQECLRVLKPGGYLLSFAGTRTQHRMAVRIEDAGFEIRDMIAWVYGSGFPKSLNIGKAVDKLQGNEREDLGRHIQSVQDRKPGNSLEGSKDASLAWQYNITKGISEWEGWGTALKPALEPITVARKPLSEKTVAENCLKWGVGGIDIDGCRVEYQGQDDWDNTFRPSGNVDKNCWIRESNSVARKDIINRSGRFPANLIHDGSDEIVSLFPNTKGGGKPQKREHIYSQLNYTGKENPDYQPYQDTLSGGGSASRFFKTCEFTGNDFVGQRFLYQAKASKSERNKGCEDLEDKDGGCFDGNNDMTNNRKIGANPSQKVQPSKNNHPTVKPTTLMEYLVKLVSREGAVVLDPFAGSGSTLIACKNLKRNWIGIEKDETYCKIANKRIADELRQKPLI
jgi:DNA modification methylase